MQRRVAKMGTGQPAWLRGRAPASASLRYARSRKSDVSAESSSTSSLDGGRRRRRGRPPSPGVDERILDVALAMLADGGYAGFRLEALAARAGVAKTTILRRWPSKAAVAAAAVEQLALQTTDVPTSGTLRGDLHALLTSAVAVFTNG